mgnify:FL=1
MRVIGNSIKSAHILSVFLIALTTAISAQSKKLKAADVLYFEKRYVEAYHAYQDIYSTQSKKDKNLLLKMADCNYQLQSWLPAYTYFSEYFNDTLYHAVPQYSDYANAARLSGHIKEAFAIYTRINRLEGDANTREYESTFRAYFDSTAYFQTYDLDAGTACVELDATESLDTLAAPMVYLWDFKDGTVKDGLRVLHCYKSGGEHKVVLSIRDKATGFVRKADTTLTVYVGEAPVKFNLRTRHMHQYLPENFEVPEPTFYGSSVVEYIWDFGDGTMDTGRKLKHTYTKLGDFKVQLGVITKNNTTGVKEKIILYRSLEVRQNFEGGTDNGK